MSVSIIQERLTSYGCSSALEEEQALREISQEIILAALGRTDFFNRAGFHGGTCLRIFHGLSRFSEDLDFALRAPDSTFRLTSYLERVRDELSAYGYSLELDDRSKTAGAVQKAFLKDESLGSLLTLKYRPRTGPMRKLRIKLEIDTKPPAGATYTMPVLDYPFPSAVRVFDLPSLFAGKIHALLCREYVKGRDWYDFIWYTSQGIGINYEFLSSAIHQIGPWQGQEVVADEAWVENELKKKITSMDWKHATEDVRRFIRANEQPSLDLWNQELFIIKFI